MIYSDQQHKYALGKMDETFHTPNLDQLCEEGILFTNAYSSNPVCGPYRVCLFTGQYSSKTGKWNNEEGLPSNGTPLAAAMKNQGYVTSYVGKWHLGDTGNKPIPQHLREGFDYFMGYQCYNGYEPGPPYSNEVIFYDESEKEHVFSQHRTDVTTRLGVESLKKVIDAKAPFFAMISYQAPHYPEQPSLEFEKIYQGVCFPKGPDYEEVDPYTPTYSPPSKKPLSLCPDYQKYGGNMEKYQQLYAAMCTQIDTGVGKIIDTLKQFGVYEETLIIYTSDHGDMQGSHGKKNKCSPYEKSCGVPFILKYPGGARNVISKELISTVDLYPTFLEAAGAQKTEASGRSFLPFLEEDKTYKKEMIIAESNMNNDCWRMCRDKRYKLVTSFRYEPELLFDLMNDPYEMNNLVREPKMQKVIQKLITFLKKETGALI